MSYIRREIKVNTKEIIESALTGNAILFLGAGFSVGAINVKGSKFFIGKELCETLIEEGNIDVEGEEERDLEDLGYISRRYLESNNTKRDLIGLLKNNYSCKTVSDEHMTIAKIPWKKIYTTNYDDVMEVSSRTVNILREPVVASEKIGEVYNLQNAIVHINGYIGKLSELTLDSTFKLTEQSYRNRTIPDSDWAMLLHNDIKNAKSVVFIGYSLGYDLELQQIFASNKSLKDKCVFVTYNPNKRTLSTMEEFGNVYAQGLKKFGEVINEIELGFCVDEVEYKLNCLSKVEKPIEFATSIVTDDIIKLFINGMIKDEILYSAQEDKYLVERAYIKKIVEFISSDGKVVILHSDLANGKSIIMRQLELVLENRGSVYYLENINSMIGDDLSYIASQKGIHYIFCENYNQLLDSEEWQLIRKYRYSNIKYIFTARSYINDNFYNRVYTDLDLDYDTMAMYDINCLTEDEVNKFVQYLSDYNIWGEQAALSISQKKKYISKNCKSEIRNILLQIYKSENVINKVNEIVKIICDNNLGRDILLTSFICDIISVDICLDDIEMILDKRINSIFFEECKEMKELVLISNNKVKIKSSSVATHIITNNDFNNYILALSCQMINKLSNHSYNARYNNILKLLISFSNLRLIFNRKDLDIKNKYISFYENARKTQFYEKNQFFWIQYAIAVMDVKDYDSAEIFLKNASSYSQDKYSEDSYQIESLKARLILEKTLHDNDQLNAFKNFEDAHRLICSNKTPERHYPYKQANKYIDFYQKFYKNFSKENKVSFMFMCTEIVNKMKEYLTNENHYERNNRRKSKEIENISWRISNIIEKMVQDE